MIVWIAGLMILCEIGSRINIETVHPDIAALGSCLFWIGVFTLTTLITLLPLLFLGLIYIYGIVILIHLFPFICIFSMLFGMILAIM